jgi:hypothetical protein
MTMELAAERMVPHLMRFAVGNPADASQAHELPPPPSEDPRST